MRTRIQKNTKTVSPLKLTFSAALIAVAVCLHMSSAQASQERNPANQEFRFKFNFKKDLFQYTQKSSTYEEAYEMAAKACFQHYKNGQKLSEDQGLDIIDICANPRS